MSRTRKQEKTKDRLVSLPVSLDRILVKLAIEERRSVKDEIVWLLEQAIKSKK